MRHVRKVTMNEKLKLAPTSLGASASVVALSNINMSFGPNQVLYDVSFAVTPGRSHALLGRNGAGKSTAVSIMTGIHKPDSGRVEFNGEPAPANSDVMAWQEKVACLYQRSTAVPTLSVAENLYLNRHPVALGGRIDWKKLNRDAQELLDQWELPVNAVASVGDLPVGSRQLVEIARALSSGTRFVILDEPTAKLDRRDSQILFGHIARMQAVGVTFLYISHHIDEIYEVAQDLTVLRDGRHVVTAEVAATSPHEVVKYMAGDTLTDGVKRSDRASRRQESRADVDPCGAVAPSLLVAKALGSDTAGERFSGVDLDVAAGEIVGLAGLEGGGKLGVAHVLVGMAQATEGSVSLAGRPLGKAGVDDAIDCGVGFVPEDRQRLGLVNIMSVAENGTLTSLGRLGRFGFVSRRRQRDVGTRMIDDLGIVTPSAVTEVGALSGGNQQKVLLGRALGTDPALLVLVQPTAGVDVRSKDALFDVIEAKAEAGAAVIIVSDDLDDLRACDRVIVMFRGRSQGEIPAGWRDADLISIMEGVDHDDQ
jgi:simple sugar transport system ATP-binding protein